MCSYNDLLQIINESGLWRNGRRNSHGFLLSPDVYRITELQHQELEALGRAIYSCLTGLSRLAAIACSPHLARGPIWALIAQITKGDIPAPYHKMITAKITAVPFICKVDLMVQTDGSFAIAEIDGHNKHGLGYTTLAAQLRSATNSTGRYLPSAVNVIAQEVMKRRPESQELILLYGDQERFYLPEFMILQQALSQHQVKLVVVSELELQLKLNSGQLIIPGASDPKPLLVDLPFLFRSSGIADSLIDLYLKRQVDFLIPPKPFLGSKALLALLKNSDHDPTLEAILISQIDQTSLSLVRRYIPDTFLLGKGLPMPSLKHGASFVLKATVSSGMKGTIFQDDERFSPALIEAGKFYSRYILQREVENLGHSFNYFNEPGELQSATWYLRVTAHFSLLGLADIVVTARQDKRVHGAKDCLQLGTVIE